MRIHRTVMPVIIVLSQAIIAEAVVYTYGITGGINYITAGKADFKTEDFTVKKKIDNAAGFSIGFFSDDGITDKFSVLKEITYSLRRLEFKNNVAT